MKEGRSFRRTVRVQDLSLRWMTRIIGLLLAACGVVFMRQEIFSGILSHGFFIACAVLGAVTVVSSFLPGPKQLRLYEKPLLEPVLQRLPGRKPSA